jgi:hypothetical protein
MVEETLPYFVEIVEYDGERVVKRMGPFNVEAKADRVASGASINLDYERFFTRVVEETLP